MIKGEGESSAVRLLEAIENRDGRRLLEVPGAVAQTVTGLPPDS